MKESMSIKSLFCVCVCERVYMRAFFFLTSKQLADSHAIWNEYHCHINTP
jgi:hypothetical protein